jgi:probable HAF family extracellular repeat protein
MKRSIHSLLLLLIFSVESLAYAASLTSLNYASGVSADGAIIVGTKSTSSGSEAFRYTAADGMVGLGVLPGGIASIGSSVSGDGSSIFGVTVFEPAEPGGAYITEMFRHTVAGGMVSLGNLPGVQSGISAVSYDGSVIVGTVDYAAFRYTVTDGMVSLGYLPGVTFAETYALDVSGDGTIIVGECFNVDRPEAYRHTVADGMVGLGFLPDAWGSTATEISNDGKVIVGYSGREAFRYTEADGMVGLGDLPGGIFDSTAEAVSGDGSVIVGRSNTSLGPEAFVYTAARGMQRLWDVLLERGVDPAADGWTRLTIATDISLDGNTIIGTGYRNGNVFQETFIAVLTVPEPGCALLTAMGLLHIATSRYRKS